MSKTARANDVIVHILYGAAYISFQMGKTFDESCSQHDHNHISGDRSYRYHISYSCLFFIS